MQINEIAAFGLDFERARIESATFKLGLANVSFSSIDQVSTFLSSLTGTKDAAAINGVLQGDGSMNLKKVLDTSNPLSDSEGYVYQFDVDPTHEMATLVTATRAYEANVRAYNTHSQMVSKALSIGGGIR